MEKHGIASWVMKFLVLSLVVFCVSLKPDETVKAQGYSGLAPAEDGNWYLLSENNVNWGYSGLYYDSNYGWWLVDNGRVNFSYTGLYCDANCGWWLVDNGCVNFSYTGLYCDANCGWWYINGGTINFTDTGIVPNEYGWWYVRNSQIDFGYSGLASNEYGWWAIVNGAIDFNYNGLAYDPNVGWWYVENGAINFDYTGLYCDAVCGWWFVNGGGITFADTGLAGNEVGWWYVENSQLNFNYTGLASNEAGWWYVENGGINFGFTGVYDDLNVGPWYIVNGSVDFGYNGTVTSNGNTYRIENGYAILISGNATVRNAVYQIVPNSNRTAALTVADSSIKDGATITAIENALESSQYFEITMVDEGRKIYRIKNVNSERYIDQGGSMDVGTGIAQNLYIDNLEDQLWYINDNNDGTYSIKSIHSNLYLTVNGSNVTQDAGGTLASQKFVLQEKTIQEEALNTNIYKVAGEYCRVTSIGDGLYTIYNTAKNGYLSAAGNSVTYVSSADSKAEKWYIANSGSDYIVQSANTNAYLTNSGGLSNASATIAIQLATDEVTDYSVRYDISALKKAPIDNNAQVVKRLGLLGLSADSLMDPINKQAELKNSINGAVAGLPTQVVDYTGSSEVDDLNRFLQANTGKIVRLQTDIEVYKATNHSGMIYIPSNTVLDGNGHHLVLKAGGEVPDEAVVMYLWDTVNQKVISQHDCGVINLKTNIPYNNNVNLWGANNVIIKDNEFSNAKLCAIVASNDYASRNVVISGNTISGTGSDSIALYGDQSSFLIENNTVTNCKGRAALMISYFKEGQHVRVDSMTTGPHDIIVNNNTVDGCTEGEGMYCIGTYRMYMTNNIIKNCKLEGVCLDFGCIGTYFANNEVCATSLSGGLPGVSIDNGMYNILDGNKIHDNTCSGIKMVRTGYCNLLVNNVCYDNSSNKTDLTGRSSSSAGIDIKCLDVYNDVDAEYIDDVGSSGNVLVNNTIYGTHDYGIYIGENSAYGRSSGNMIESNSILSSYQYGVIDYSGQYNTIKNNIEY